MTLKNLFFLVLISLFSPFLFSQTPEALPNPELLKNPWTAKWITHPTAPTKEYGVFHFRKTFSLSHKPASFIINVSADNRYKLFVNGKQVSFGPARSDVDHWNFETIDIAAYLNEGSNVIASVVWNWGEFIPYSQMSYRTAFIIQGNTQKERVVNSDTSWRVIKNEAYHPVVFRPNDKRIFWQYYVAGSLDSVNAQQYPWGWQELNFDHSKWNKIKVISSGYPNLLTNPNHWNLTQRIIPLLEEKHQRFSKLRRAEGIQANEDLLTDKKDLIVPARTKVKLLLDHEVLTIGYPELVISDGKGSKIKMMYAEALFDEAKSLPMFRGMKGNRNEIGGFGMYGIYDAFISDGGKDRKFTPLWFRTFRYVQLEIETAEEPLVLNDISSRFSAYPFKENAYFKSNDPTLAKIWDVSWRTARLCAYETYMDCPYYEQLQYFGDTRIQTFVSLHVSGDDRLMKNAILHGDYSRIPEGITNSRYPSELPQFTPLYSLVWALMVKDYWMYRDDKQFVQQFIPGIKTVTDWFERKINNENMLEGLPYLDFVDSKYPRQKVSDNSRNKGMTVHTLFYVYSLQELAPMMENLGFKQEAEAYLRLADKLKKTVQEKCYDERKGLFADTPDKNFFSQHASLLAVLTSTVEKGKEKEVMEKVLSDKTLLPCETYFQFYLFQALKKAGMGDLYLNNLQAWKNMLAQGLTTFGEWEDNPRSDCHAWSASPNYDFIATVCGIEPASPGFKTVKIEPHLGYLTSVEGRMPHPFGELKINLNKKGEKLAGEVFLPKGLEGKFVWKGKEMELKEGKTVISKQ